MALIACMGRSGHTVHRALDISTAAWISVAGTQGRLHMGMLDGKVAIITGATSGIGERAAQLFVEEGARVVFTGRRKAQGEAVAKRLGANASFVAADATAEADWARLIGHVLERHGRLDALFNNAGGPLHTAPGRTAKSQGDARHRGVTDLR